MVSPAVLANLRRQLHLSTYMYKIMNDQAPSAFASKFSYVSGGSRNAENCNLYTPKAKTHKSFSYLGAKCWNSLPLAVRTTDNIEKFSQILKTSFMDMISNDHLYRPNNKFDFLYEIGSSQRCVN